MKLSERIQSVKPSATLTIDARAKELQGQGREVVALSAGEPDFALPKTAMDAGIKAFQDGFSHYTMVHGLPALRQAISKRLKEDFNLTYDADHVVVGCGAKVVLYHLFQILLNPGDEVVIPAPYWVSYPDQVLLAGGVPKILATRESEDFVPRAEDLEKLITPRTKALVLNAPSNPSGAVLEPKHLKALADVLKKHPDVLVISDEIYAHLVYDGFRQESIAAVAPELREQVVIVNGMSKSYAMTGLRIGYAAGPTMIINALKKIQGQTTSNPSSTAQMASLGALTGDQSIIGTMLKSFNERRLHMHKRLIEMPGVSCYKPRGAFYCFPNVSAYYGKKTPDGRVLKDSVDLATYLLEEMGVATVPGTPFGAPENIRLSFATSVQNIDKGLDRMRDGLKKLI